MMTLSDQEKIRYERNIILDQFGTQAQQKLKNASVLVVGAGGLGSASLQYLAAAGVGRIGIADGDRVELHNLQRQVIHNTASIGQMKVFSAKNYIENLNPETVTECYPFYLGPAHCEELFAAYDFIIDATDRLEMKYLINDTCVRMNKPFSHGAVIGMIGQTLTWVPTPGETKKPGFHGTVPCYRCLIPTVPEDTIPPTGKEKGVLGTVCGVIGIIQATEAIKYITSVGDLLLGRILSYDAVSMRFEEIQFSEDPRCLYHGKI